MVSINNEFFSIPYTIDLISSQNVWVTYTFLNQSTNTFQTG